MMLNKASSIPLHVQLANLLREQVVRHQLRPNDRLPSERELCQQYGISRITVRQALSELAKAGLVYSSIGKGTYVAEAAFQEEFQPLSSFTHDLERRGMRAASQVLEASLLPADDHWSEIFFIPRGAEVVRLHRLRLTGDAPIAIQLTHLPHHLCPHLLEYDFSSCSLYEVLRNVYKLHLARSETVIEAALASSRQAELLRLPQPTAVLISQQTTLLDNGIVIEMTRSIFNSERYKLHMRL
jgi:GntR family transcriptional regulator